MGYPLPRKGKPYQQRKDAETGACLIPNRVDIDERRLCRSEGRGRSLGGRYRSWPRWVSCNADQACFETSFLHT